MRKLALRSLALAAALGAALPAAADRLSLEIAGEANGTIVIELDKVNAPNHAEQIAALAEEGAYDGIVFHRVIDGFMAQTGDVKFGKLGGDMRLAGTGGSERPSLKAEFSAVPFEAGSVGMARSSSPDSANSQFFMMFAPAPHLNGQYTVIGKVVEGMDVLNAIKLGAGPNGAVIGEPDHIVKATITRD